MFTKNGHDIIKLSIEFSDRVCDISKTCITKQIYTKIFDFVDPMYWFTIDMYSTDRWIRTTKSDQLAFVGLNRMSHSLPYCSQMFMSL